jgi:hypothetical protein
VVQPEGVFEFPMVVLHPPMQLGQAHQPLQGAVGRQAREPVLDRLGLARRPLGQQPAHPKLPATGGAAQLDPGRAHPQHHKPGAQLVAIGAFTPGHRAGGILTGGQHQLAQRRAALAVARHRPPPPTRVLRRLRRHLLRVGAERAGDLHHVGELALLQAKPELANLPGGGVGEQHRRNKAPNRPTRRASPRPAATSRGRNSRHEGGQEAWSVTAWTDTPTWQLATFPSAPQSWEATPHRPAAKLGECGVIDHPGGRDDRGGHALGQPPAYRHRVPGGLVDELLQRLLQRVGVRVGVTTGQPRGHRLDRLALAVQQQPPQVALAPAALVLAGEGRQDVLGEGGPSGSDASKLCGCHGLPPVVVAHSFQLGIALNRHTHEHHPARANGVLLGSLAQMQQRVGSANEASPGSLPPVIEMQPSGDFTLHWIKPFIVDANVSLAIGILAKVFLHGPLGA